MRITESHIDRKIGEMSQAISLFVYVCIFDDFLPNSSRAEFLSRKLVRQFIGIN